MSGPAAHAHAALCMLRAGAPLGAILNFLLQLGFREVGSAFRLESLSRVERTIASDIAQLGTPHALHVILPPFSNHMRPPNESSDLCSKESKQLAARACH